MTHFKRTSLSSRETMVNILHAVTGQKDGLAKRGVVLVALENTSQHWKPALSSLRAAAFFCPVACLATCSNSFSGITEEKTGIRVPLLSEII